MVFGLPLLVEDGMIFWLFVVYYFFHSHILPNVSCLYHNKEKCNSNCLRLGLNVNIVAGACVNAKVQKVVIYV